MIKSTRIIVPEYCVQCKFWKSTGNLWWSSPLPDGPTIQTEGVCTALVRLGKALNTDRSCNYILVKDQSSIIISGEGLPTEELELIEELKSLK